MRAWDVEAQLCWLFLMQLGYWDHPWTSRWSSTLASKWHAAVSNAFSWAAPFRIARSFSYNLRATPSCSLGQAWASLWKTPARIRAVWPSKTRVLPSLPSTHQADKLRRRLSFSLCNRYHQLFSKTLYWSIAAMLWASRVRSWPSYSEISIQFHIRAR